MYLIFDVGGTFIKYALLNDQGTIFEKSKIKTPMKPDDNIDTFVDAIGNVYDSYKEKTEIEGIGMSLPGQVDIEEGIVYGGGAILYLHEAHVRTLIENRCDHVRVAIENDAKCAALAEVWMGNASDCADVVVLVFGTGIGGGIIKDKKIHRGKNLGAGEVSFAISKLTRMQLEKIQNGQEEQGIHMWGNFDSTGARTIQYAKLKQLELDEVSGEFIYEQAEAGDEETIEFLEDWYFSIAKFCCSIQAFYDPERILIGGGISAQPLFIEGIKRYVEKMRCLVHIYDNVQIEVCKYRNDSNLLGAMYHFVQTYII